MAFSRTSPLNHSFLFVYSDSVEKKENYAHEIGHMLGLPHSFYTDKEKKAYKNTKESILGNDESEFIYENGKNVDNPKYKSGINKDISTANNYDYFNMTVFYSLDSSDK
ncbi:M43 family zinc metalloprotease, partial [Flavobacterium sp. PL002]|uniref:M43 family zinc metalloprotease n=1 Tax=Flavobacterium sp. PL002 TaxID=1897058 RepID=UPI0017885187